MPFRLALLALLACTTAVAADLGKVERGIGREPKYKAPPKYCLLVFGPEAKERVWLVQDGDTLYVDRNGNGDLTEAGKKIAANTEKNLDPKEYGYTFQISELRAGGRVHKHLWVNLTPLRRYADNPDFKNRPEFKAALKENPNAFTYRMGIDVECVKRKGGGEGGRVSHLVGAMDLNGPLIFADSPTTAPIVHFDGPWEITFYAERPVMRLGREFDMVLVAGTPGQGPGTFAMVDYDKTIPENVYPKIEVQFAAAKPGDPPRRELYELKERC
jgi:hypothetical protein